MHLPSLSFHSGAISHFLDVLQTIETTHAGDTMKSRFAIAACAALLSLLLFNINSTAQITASAIGLSAGLQADQETTRDITLSNATGQEIPFKVKFSKVEREGGRQAPHRDEIGDVIAEYQIENGRWYTGIAWDGQEMWGFNHNGGEVISFNPENRQVTERWNAGVQGITGLEYANDELWIPDRNNQTIHRFDVEGNALDGIRVPRDQPIDVAWDGEFIWYTCLGNDRTRLFQINMDGELNAQSSFQMYSGMAGPQWSSSKNTLMVRCGCAITAGAYTSSTLKKIRRKSYRP